MITIRNNTFETNSSSTHSMVMCSLEESKKWADGELFYQSIWGKDNPFKSDFITKEEAINYIVSKSTYTTEDLTNREDYDLFEIFREYDIYAFDLWGENYETDSNTYVTKSGETVVAHCYFGYDY